MMSFFVFALEITLVILINEVNMSVLEIPIFSQHMSNLIALFCLFPYGPVRGLAAGDMAAEGLRYTLASLPSRQGLTLSVSHRTSLFDPHLQGGGDAGGAGQHWRSPGGAMGVLGAPRGVGAPSLH